MKPETKTCQNCKQNFTIKTEDFSFYEKIKVPPPTLCFECRMKRKMAWRNERTWHKRICDATGKSILSIFNANSPYKVYDQVYWKSDAWDALSYGRDYDFSRSFFEQFDELMKATPHPNLISRNSVNSDYANYCTDARNCYFSWSFVVAEDSAYLFGAVMDTKFSMDLHQCMKSEYCYNLIDCVKSYQLSFSQNCEGCVESAFLYDCKNCNNCIGCVGLRNQSYNIFNQQYTKENFFKKLKEIKINSRQGIKEISAKFEALKLRVPRKFAYITKSEYAIGDDILNAKNVYWGFYARNEVENIRYSFRVWENTRDVCDGIIVWDKSEICYEGLSISGQRVIGSSLIWGGFDIFYSYNCFACNNIFGCVGLRNKSYCIFNKQYSKDDYETITSKIIEAMRKSSEYGEFFPAKYSPFGYNESFAFEYFPITKSEAETDGFNWAEIEEKNHNFTIKNTELSDTIDDVSESILKEAIECAHVGKCNHNCSVVFRISNFELSFYKKFNIPLPELCPFCRHGERLAQKNPLKLWHRQCMCEKKHTHHSGACLNEFETSYAPNRSEVIYCEQCYQQEVY